MRSIWDQYRNHILVGSVLASVLAICLFVYRRSGITRIEVEPSFSTLKQYQDKLKEEPYNGTVLLRSARHSYHLIRKKLTKQDVDTKKILKLIEGGLQNYRRIGSVDEWSLTPRDYFYNAYLYYQLSRLRSNSMGGVSSLNRAKKMALRAYEADYRSPELITLLGNLHYRTGEYKVALDYYDSLGKEISDPDVLFNKAWVQRALGDFNKAVNLLRRAIQTLPEQGPVTKKRRFELAMVRLQLDQKNYRKAMNRIRSIPGHRGDPEALTLYAQSLVGLEKKARATDILRNVIEKDGAPEHARKLLNELTSQESDQESDVRS